MEKEEGKGRQGGREGGKRGLLTSVFVDRGGDPASCTSTCKTNISICSASRAKGFSTVNNPLAAPNENALLVLPAEIKNDSCEFGPEPSASVAGMVATTEPWGEFSGMDAVTSGATGVLSFSSRTLITRVPLPVSWGTPLSVAVIWRVYEFIAS